MNLAIVRLSARLLLNRKVSAKLGKSSGKIAELPGPVKSKLRFRGEDVVNITDLLSELEASAPDSVDAADLPEPSIAAGKTTHRSIAIDGSEIEFSDGFAELHTRVYARTLEGHGFGIADARPATELVHAIRTSTLSPGGSDAHPVIRGTSR